MICNAKKAEEKNKKIRRKAISEPSFFRTILHNKNVTR
jgi:hypothetical protein